MLVGTFQPQTTRDAVSVERTGQAVEEVNALSGGQVEVLFADGEWMLAAPDDVVPTFFLEAWPDEHLPAVRYGDWWNGWATPVTDRLTVERLMRVTGEPHRWDGATLVHGDEDERLSPLPDGTYDLGTLGWMFLRTDLDA